MTCLDLTRSPNPLRRPQFPNRSVTLASILISEDYDRIKKFLIE